MTATGADTEPTDLAPGYDRARLLELADLTLADFVSHLTRCGEAGTVEDGDGVLLFAGAHPQPNPYRNGVIRTDPTVPAGETIERATRFFTQHRRGFALWASEHSDGDLRDEAEARGLTPLETLPELVLDRLPEDLPPPEGIEIRQALDEQTRRDYVDVVAQAWGMSGMPHEMASRVFFSTASIDAPSVSAFVAYLQGIPVSGAMTLLSHGVALGCQAATVRRLPSLLPRSDRPARERRGLADACLSEALRHSFTELGAELSLCQTSSLGAPVWTRLGYTPFTSYRRYVVPPAAPAR